MAVIGIVTATLLLCGALVMMDVDAEGPGAYLFGFALCVPIFSGRNASMPLRKRACKIAGPWPAR